MKFMCLESVGRDTRIREYGDDCRDPGLCRMSNLRRRRSTALLSKAGSAQWRAVLCRRRESPDFLESRRSIGWPKTAIRIES